MRPFLPKNTHPVITDAVNLPGLLQRHGLNYTPMASMQAAQTRESYTRAACFRQAVDIHALQAVNTLPAPASLGVAVAAWRAGRKMFLGYAVTQLVGTSADAPPEMLSLLREGLVAGGHPAPDAAVDNYNRGNKTGVLGLVELLLAQRAEAAHACGRGLAHAAYSSAAIGCNALLWTPRLVNACLTQAIVLTCALLGACAGAARFCIDTATHGRVRSPLQYIRGLPPRIDEIGPTVAQLRRLDLESGWLARVFERPGPATLAAAQTHLDRLRAPGAEQQSTTLDAAITRLATAVARERSDDAQAHAMLGRLTRCFFGDVSSAKAMAPVYRRRSLAVHPDKGDAEPVRMELTCSLNALKDRIERLPTLQDAFFSTPKK